MELINYTAICLILILSILHYFFHKNKNTGIAISIFWIVFVMIIENIVNSNISMWVWIWLFWIVSLIRFKEMFENDIDIVYLFLSLWIAIIWAFNSDILLFISFFVIIFIWLFTSEKFLNTLKIMKYTSDIEKELVISNIEKSLNIKIIKHSCINYDNYKLLKEYKIYYIDNN